MREIIENTKVEIGENFNEIYVQVRAGGLADFFQRLRLPNSTRLGVIPPVVLVSL